MPTHTFPMCGRVLVGLHITSYHEICGFDFALNTYPFKLDAKILNICNFCWRWHKVRFMFFSHPAALKWLYSISYLLERERGCVCVCLVPVKWQDYNPIRVTRFMRTKLLMNLCVCSCSSHTLDMVCAVCTSSIRLVSSILLTRKKSIVRCHQRHYVHISKFHSHCHVLTAHNKKKVHSLLHAHRTYHDNTNLSR